MTVSRKFESILICPITHKPLQRVEVEAIQALNQQLHEGNIRPSTGEVTEKTVTQALQVKDKDLYYPIEDGIYCLLPDLALMSDEVQREVEADRSTGLFTKNEVRQFYDQIGWQAKHGVYQDASDSEDLREVSSEYITRCHQRVKTFLPSKGEYLLDVASGPVQYPDYLTYSQDYSYRICADISILALQEAKKKLGEKGLYILCDMTNLPFKPNSIDAIVSLHTIYHIPKDEQAKAFSEIHRALKEGGTSAIVYSWGGRSLLMALLMLPQKALTYLKRSMVSPPPRALYFYAHSFQWVKENVQQQYHTQLFSWRSVNVPFLKAYIHRMLGGRWILKILFALESRFPKLMGKVGAYPLLVSTKRGKHEGTV